MSPRPFGRNLNLIPGAGERIAGDFQADVPLDQADSFLGSVLTCLRCGSALGPVWSEDTAQLYMSRHRIQTHDTDPDAKARERLSTRKCSTPGCNRPHYASGLCSLHWGKLHPDSWVTLYPLNREDRPKRTPKPVVPCGVPDCERPMKLRGFCIAHARRLQRTGDVQAHIPLGAPRGGLRGSDAR